MNMKQNLLVDLICISLTVPDMGLLTISVSFFVFYPHPRIFFFHGFVLERVEGTGRHREKHRRERHIDRLPPAYPDQGQEPASEVVPLSGIKPGPLQSKS